MYIATVREFQESWNLKTSDRHKQKKHSLAGFSRSLSAVRRLLFLIRHLKKILEHFLVLVVDDWGHLKLSLQCFDLLLKGKRQRGHLDPLLHLFEKLYQTGWEEEHENEDNIFHTSLRDSLRLQTWDQARNSDNNSFTSARPCCYH